MHRLFNQNEFSSFSPSFSISRVAITTSQWVSLLSYPLLVAKWSIAPSFSRQNLLPLFPPFSIAIKTNRAWGEEGEERAENFLKQRNSLAWTVLWFRDTRLIKRDPSMRTVVCVSDRKFLRRQIGNVSHRVCLSLIFNCPNVAESIATWHNLKTFRETLGIR